MVQGTVVLGQARVIVMREGPSLTQIRAGANALLPGYPVPSAFSSRNDLPENPGNRTVGQLFPNSIHGQRRPECCPLVAEIPDPG